MLAVFTMVIMLPSLVEAQGLKNASGVLQGVGSKAGADTYTDPETVIGVTLNAALTLVGLIFLILMVYAGYLWMTARGQEEVVKKAQNIIIAATIGLVIVLSAYSITYFVTARFQ